MSFVTEMSPEEFVEYDLYNSMQEAGYNYPEGEQEENSQETPF